MSNFTMEQGEVEEFRRSGGGGGGGSGYSYAGLPVSSHPNIGLDRYRASVVKI